VLFVDHKLIADQQDRQPGSLGLEENAGSLPYVSARKTRGPLVRASFERLADRRAKETQGLSIARRLGEESMTLEEAKRLIQQTRSFIGTIYSNEVVLDGKVKLQELEAIVFVMQNRPAPPYETAE
jgi:hypothetical protein